MMKTMTKMTMNVMMKMMTLIETMNREMKMMIPLAEDLLVQVEPEMQVIDEVAPVDCLMDILVKVAMELDQVAHLKWQQQQLQVLI